MIATSDLRRRRGSLAITVLLVAVVTCAVLATLAGARRSSSTLSRLLDATNAGDHEIAIWGVDATSELADRLKPVDGLDDLGLAHAFLLSEPTRRDFTLVSSPDDSMLNRSDRPLVVGGRLPRSDAADEVALNEVAARELDLAIGDRLHGAMAEPDLFERLVAGKPFPGFHGPNVDLIVVGIVRIPQDLMGDAAEANPIGIASPAFDHAHAGRAATSTLASVDGDDPAALARLQQSVDTLSVAALGAEVQDQATQYRDVRSAINMLTTGLLVFALIALAAGAMAVGQAINRDVASAAAPGTTGRALGLTPRQAAMSSALPSIAAGAIGVALGATAAVLASPMFPLSLARRAEPKPGISIDWVALGAGSVVAILALAVWSYASAARSRRAHQIEATPRSVLGRAYGPPVVNLAVARALRTAGRQRAARASAVGIGLALAGVTGVLVFDRTLDDALASPPRWGWTWSSRPDMLDPSNEQAILDGLANDPEIAGVGFLDRADVKLAGRSIMGEALEIRSGSLAFALADGRLPVAAGEVALGARELSALHVSLGDQVAATRADGTATALLVVGRVALPVIDTEAPGDGAAFTADGLAQFVDGEPDRTLVLRYAPGVGRVRLERRLHDEYGLDVDIVYAQPKPPVRLANLHEVIALLPPMGVFFAALCLLALTHSLLMSSRASRRETAVLSALGLRRWQLQQIVVCQGVLVMVSGLVAGLVIGTVVGRLVWHLSVSDIGMLGGSSTPWLAFLILAAAAIGSAVAVAWPIAVKALAARPSASLRAE